MKQTIVLLVITFIFSTISNAKFQVNTHTTNHQRDVDIAMDSTGNFTAVWNSYGQDGNSGGIFGQRFDSIGQPLAGDITGNGIVEIEDLKTLLFHWAQSCEY